MQIRPYGTQVNHNLLKSHETLEGNMLQRNYESKLKTEFDLIIIGGGINGCGIARDAANRGLKVLLIEKEDFGAGCTAASTRLIHGGLRYLEHLEIDLVRESLREREILLKNANHLVKPLELCIPIYKGDKRGEWLIKAGMLLYDVLSYDKSLPWHRMISSDDFCDYEPGIKDEGLIAAAVYHDAQTTYAERICLENVLMANEKGALTLNHAEVVDINIEKDKMTSVNFQDKLSGKKLKAQGKIIINVSGPWVDSLNSLSKFNLKKQIGGTKGSHIIVEKFSGGPKHAIYASSKSDNRPFFIIPWQKNYYLIGTTDIPFSGDLDKVHADINEINYLICESNRILKNKVLTQKDILFSYSGVRPLPFVDHKDPSSITRKHIIFDHEKEGLKNYISIIGGKLTTYRNLSELVIDHAFKKLNYNFISSKTKEEPLIGNIDESNIEQYKKRYFKRVENKYDLEPEIVSHLIDLYGKRFKAILDIVKEKNDKGKLLSSNSLDIRAQVDYALNNELAYTISDVMLRRTTSGLNKGLGQDAIPQVSMQLKELLGYSQNEIDKQVKEYEEKVIKGRVYF